MTRGRSIQLDLSTGSAAQRSEADNQSAGGQRREPDAGARQKFEQALNDDPNGLAREEPVLPSGPFELLGMSRAHAPAQAVEPAGELAGNLKELLDRFMVGQGSAGGRQVRMQLKDEAGLPGVSAVIEQVEGRLQVDFICACDRSQQRLISELPRNADPLARRIGREVLLRVLADTPDSVSLLEVLGQA